MKGTIHHSEVRSGKNSTVQFSARKFSTTYYWKLAKGEDIKELKLIAYKVWIFHFGNLQEVIACRSVKAISVFRHS